MDIGKLPNNDFYSGYEDDTEVILSIEGNNEKSIHIWEGYFEDIFRHASLDGNGWSGFTRDLQQGERTFNSEGIATFVDIDEYLSDLLKYKDCTFEFDETSACLNMLCDFFAEAKQNHCRVAVMVS